MIVAELTYDGDGSNVYIHVNEKMICDNLFMQIDEHLMLQGYTDDDIEEFWCEMTDEYFDAYDTVFRRIVGEYGVTHVLNPESERPTTPITLDEYLSQK